jgi:UDP-N-acetyl-D-galactosamine dehydrogenase
LTSKTIAVVGLGYVEHGVELTPIDLLPKADGVVLAVAHREYRALDVERMTRLVNPRGVVVDVKACLPRQAFECAGFRVWRL